MDAPECTSVDQLCGMAADEKGWAAHVNDLFPNHQPKPRDGNDTEQGSAETTAEQDTAASPPTLNKHKYIPTTEADKAEVTAQPDMHQYGHSPVDALGARLRGVHGVRQ